MFTTAVIVYDTTIEALVEESTRRRTSDCNVVDDDKLEPPSVRTEKMYTLSILSCGKMARIVKMNAVCAVLPVVKFSAEIPMRFWLTLKLALVRE